jgi:hypothetical protein
LLLTTQPETLEQLAVVSLSHDVGVPLQVTPLLDHVQPLLLKQVALVVASLHVEVEVGVPVHEARPFQ